MRRTLASDSAARQPQTGDVDVLAAELRAAMLAPASHNRRHLPPSVRYLEGNVRKRVNKAPDTVATLCAGRPDRALRVRDILGRFFLPALPARTDRGAFFREETEIEGRINNDQAIEQTRDLSTAERRQYVTDLEEYERLLDQWVAWERAPLALPTPGLRPAPRQ